VVQLAFEDVVVLFELLILMAVELESELESDSFGGYDSVIALLWSLLDRSTRHEGDKEEYGYFASFHLVVVLRVYRSAYESVNCGR